MFQRPIPMGRMALFSLLFLFPLPVSRASAQTHPLNVTFESISIRPSTVFRDTAAGFPHWVMSLITVKDENEKYVHGLANRTRWLLPTEHNENGMLVDSAWSRVLEYHAPPFTPPDDTTHPAQPDVKELESPEFMVTEVFDVGISVMLVMDYSGSLGDDIHISEDAARFFVRNKEDRDKVGIIKFTGKVELFQELTSDTTLLMQAISKPTTTREFTALYDALYTGIEKVRNAGGRKAVIAYTDGNDNRSTHTIEDVIDLSTQSEVPVFLIGLGERVKDYKNELKRIAEEPGLGGEYTEAEEVEELQDLYIRFYGMISGYYVLATRSTDPFYNGTYRWVDIVLVQDDTTGGTGRGKYHVPFVPSDLSVDKTVLPSSTAHTNDTLLYRITVTNTDTVFSQGFSFTDFPFDSLTPFDFSVLPDIHTADSLVWMHGRLDAGESFIVEYRCIVDTMDTSAPLRMTNIVTLSCASDVSPANNTDSATVFYQPLTPPDVGILKEGRGDFQDAQDHWFVLRRDTAHYTVTLTNSGEQAAENILVTDALPDSVTLIDFSPGSSILSADGKTLQWTVATLESRNGPNHGVAEFRYSCLVDSTPPWDFRLDNTAEIRYTLGGVPVSRADRDTMWVEGIEVPNPSVAVSRPVIEPGDTITVFVMSPIPIEADHWELAILYADSGRNDVFFNPMIDTTELDPYRWIALVPEFDETRMAIDGHMEEAIGVVFTTTDTWGIRRSASTAFLVRSPEEFYLDENVFRPHVVSPLGMRFMLNSNRYAEIRIYDIAGGYVADAYSGAALAGRNTAVWDGRDADGRNVGSGLYVAILTSGDFQKARKFILVR